MTKKKPTASRIFYRAARLWRNKAGQDLIEYALLAGFIAISAGAIMPTVSSNISKIFSKISSTLSASAAIS